MSGLIFNRNRPFAQLAPYWAPNSPSFAHEHQVKLFDWRVLHVNPDIPACMQEVPEKGI